MVAPPLSRRYTREEYRAVCDTTDQILDYWDGVITDRVGNPIQFDADGSVLDFAGAMPTHGMIVVHVLGEVGNRLRDSRCFVLDASVQVQMGREGRIAHPDATVCCGELQLIDETTTAPVIVNPRLVFEVISPTTMNYDQTTKADGYRQIESLQEYVFVWQDEPRVETFYRSADGVWSIGGAVTDLAGSVRLRSVDVELPLAEVYARVVFPPPPPGGRLVVG